MQLDAEAVKQAIARLTSPGAPFALTQYDVGGVPVAGYANAARDLRQLLQAGREYGEQTFIVYEGTRISYTRFYEKADELACYLQQHCGLRPGERVAIAMRNCPQWAVAFVAAALCGAVLVPLNSWGRTDELAFGVDDCGASVLFCDPPRAALLAGATLRKAPRVIVANNEPGASEGALTGFELPAQNSARGPLQPVTVAPGDVALIIYTSGSTGSPKGAVHRHVGVAQAVMNMFFTGALTAMLEGARQAPGALPQESPLLTVPLFHGTGLCAGLLLPLQLGHKVVMMYKWDAGTALALIEKEKITGITSVPTVLQSLFSHPDYDRYDTGSLYRVGAAGAATPDSLAGLISERLPQASRSAGWGMSETLAVGSSMTGAVFRVRPESSGLRSPVMEMRVVDTDGAVLDQGAVGELEVRGITVCAGYWNNAEASAQVLHDGWMKTGDLARVDGDDFVHITGRIKDIVIRGGENIYPGEIENVASRVEGVREVVVFGVPDPVMGEELAMVVFAPAPNAPSVAELKARLSASLAAYKVPRHIELREEALPQNVAGKIDKRGIRAAFIAAMDSE